MAQQRLQFANLLAETKTAILCFFAIINFNMGIGWPRAFAESTAIKKTHLRKGGHFKTFVLSIFQPLIQNRFLF
jgi:hypothetical protein